MKTYLTEGWFRHERCLRFKAVIPKSTKHGIPRSYQKTWHVQTVLLVKDRRKIMPMFKAEARRWRAKIMAKLFPSKPEQVVIQEEIQ